jgi:putative tricarboxylic transport membrane protein
MNLKPFLLIASGLLALSAGFAQNSQRYEIMVPFSAGGRAEAVARAIEAGLKTEHLASDVHVYFVPGNGTTVGMSQFMKLKGDATQLMVVSVNSISGLLTNPGLYSLSDLTPIARLTAEYEMIVVPSKSPYKSMADLVTAFKANPTSIVWGGTTTGGTSHIVAAQLAEQLGVPVKSVKYTPSAGSGQAFNALMAGDLTVITSNYKSMQEELASGRVRALAVAAPERLAQVEAPTLHELGYDIEMSYWAGVAALPDITSSERYKLQSTFSRLARSSTWRKTITDNAWNTYFANSEPFRLFIDREHTRIQSTLRSLDILK